MAISAASRAVSAPTTTTTVWAVPEASNSVWVLATRNTPAVTMVAAWIRADTGVGPAIASGSQTYSGNWALLPVQARNSSSATAVAVPVASPLARPKTSSKSRLPTVEPEADEQVRAQADPLPAEEHDQEVLGEHQDQHRGHEQVEPGEERLPALVVGHVADRVQVDQAGDAGDDQGHDGRELVPAQVEGDPQVAGGDEVVAAQHRGAGLGVPAEQLEEGGD